MVNIVFLLISGFNNPAQNKLSLTELSDNIDNLKLTYPLADVIVRGDYNMVYDEYLDRYPSKSQYSSHNPILSHFCDKHDSVDPWRFKHPDIKQYSWFKPNNTLKSGIDFWLISTSMIHSASDCCMSAAPLSDHAVIKLSFKPPGSRYRNRGYWKFNSALLNCQVYCDGIKSNCWSDGWWCKNFICFKVGVFKIQNLRIFHLLWEII